MSVLDFALGLAGVPQQTIDDVEKVAPQTAALLKLIKDNQPLIQRAQAVAAEAVALYTQAEPLIEQARAEVAAIMPAAEEVVAFIQKQSQPTGS